MQTFRRHKMMLGQRQSTQNNEMLPLPIRLEKIKKTDSSLRNDGIHIPFMIYQVKTLTSYETT